MAVAVSDSPVVADEAVKIITLAGAIGDSLDDLLPGVTLTETSLTIPADAQVRRKGWLRAVHRVTDAVNEAERQKTMFLWWLADLMRFAEDGRISESMQALADVAGLTRGSMHNVAWIGKVVPEARQPDRGFWWHLPLAHLGRDAQTRWVEVAVRDDLSQRALIDRIQVAKLEAAGQDPDQATIRAAISTAAATVPAGPRYDAVRAVLEEARGVAADANDGDDGLDVAGQRVNRAVLGAARTINNSLPIKRRPLAILWVIQYVIELGRLDQAEARGLLDDLLVLLAAVKDELDGK